MENSRSHLNSTPQLPVSEQKLESVVDMASYRDIEEADIPSSPEFQNAEQPLRFVTAVTDKAERKTASRPERKPISEVLHDIYDKNIQ